MIYRSDRQQACRIWVCLSTDDDRQTYHRTILLCSKNSLLKSMVPQSLWLSAFEFSPSRTQLDIYVHSLKPTSSLFSSFQVSSAEHYVLMSCSTFMTDGKCAARCTRFSLPLSASPFTLPSTRWSRHRAAISDDRRHVNKRRSSSKLKQWKKRPHPLHQYYSLTW